MSRSNVWLAIAIISGGRHVNVLIPYNSITQPDLPVKKKTIIHNISGP
jgi:hypothetical protein